MAERTLVVIGSAAFPNVYLRMNGEGVAKSGTDGGVVNLQNGVWDWEQFYMTEDQGVVTFESAAFPGVFLRMDGRATTKNRSSGSGTVNCQCRVGGWEKFRLEGNWRTGDVAIASTTFPNVYLRVNGQEVTHYMNSGGGTVNCQLGASGWERFRIRPAAEILARKTLVVIGSAAFPNVYLRMNGQGVADSGTDGGTVNLQNGVRGWEQFYMTEDNGVVTFESAAFHGVFLRMDGRATTKNDSSGSGTVNCQCRVGEWEKFRLVGGDWRTGKVAIASTVFPNVYLRVNGEEVSEYRDRGGGTVNCQYGASEWEQFYIRPAADLLKSFSLVITSDPQYPWHDDVLPPQQLDEDEKKRNSERQIRQQYRSIHELALELGGTPRYLAGVLINGDLTAFGHDWQMDKYKELLGELRLPYYPGLGNHDYANNVDDSFMENCACRMVLWMFDWLKDHKDSIEHFDFRKSTVWDGTVAGFLPLPYPHTEYTGSLAYSYNIGSLHVIQLQNYPTYEESWTPGKLGLVEYQISSSMNWLKGDLNNARTRGDTIIVNLHDYGDEFIGDDLSAFESMMREYGVSAVFAGHIHKDCGYCKVIPNSAIPVFRCGSASYQDYLVARFDFTERKLHVSKRKSDVVDGNVPTGNYYDEKSATWTFDLNLPRAAAPLPANV